MNDESHSEACPYSASAQKSALAPSAQPTRFLPLACEESALPGRTMLAYAFTISFGRFAVILV